jgi:predicted ferric reductase
MFTTSNSHQKSWPIWVSVGATLLIWLGSKWYYADWFDNPFHYPAKTASLTATVLMCWSMILVTRVRFLETFFGGLDKMYQVHKRIGKTAFFIIFVHPLFLAADRLPDPVNFLLGFWFMWPEGDRYLWGHNLGIVTLLLFAALIVLTLWATPAYHIWKMTHEWMGFVLLLILVHVFVVQRDVAAYPLLTVWMYSFLFLGLCSFVWIRFLYWRHGPKYGYAVDQIEHQGDIVKLILSPQGEKMDFRPSQFIYLVVHKEGISPEPHPYSIASGYNLAANFRLGIKQVGDHTRTLDRLEKGDPVTVYGPYGRFSEPFLSGTRDCVFIGGGIGITPFLGMWHVALHSEERLPEQDVPERLRIMHPEIIRTWKSPRVSLFYVCREAEDASFDLDIRKEVELCHLQGFEGPEQRGHSYELYLSSERGRVTAEYFDKKVGGLKEKFIFLCGPTAMTDDLTRQMLEMGVAPERIIEEDFDLLD